MAKPSIHTATLVTCTLAAVLLISASTAESASTGINNVAIQWTVLYEELYCLSNFLLEPNGILQAQLHLAQWHALLALKDTGSCTSEEAVVAFASHKVMSTYFSSQQDSLIDPLLSSQLKTLGLSDKQKKLGKRLGEAAAIGVLTKVSPAKEFALDAVKEALDENDKNPIPGLYRYLNNTPAGRENAKFVFYNLPITQPYVVPDAVEFIATYLSNLKPPKVPSEAWNKEYNMEKDIGRADWPGRTLEMNILAAITTCPTVNGTRPICSTETFWSEVVGVVLPKETSLYNTVLTLAKVSVTIHDTYVVLSTLQFGFWFWRPEMAFKAGDMLHKPIPTWTPFAPTPAHAEYPSGAAAGFSAGAAALQMFFGKGTVVPFTLDGLGVFSQPCRIAGVTYGSRHYGSFADVVREIQLSRVYAGAHWNISVVDGATVGRVVAEYVEKQWTKPTPSGVLPNSVYLNVLAELPPAAGDWSPIKLGF